MTETYAESYARLARDHVAHWRETGSNPFIPDLDAQQFTKATLELLRRWVPAGARVLDAGCGMGDVLGMAPEYDRHGLDIASEYLEIAAARGIAVTQGRVEAMPYPDDHFDAVLAMDLLEHVFDLNAVVRELVRVTKRGGIIIARTPNCEDLSGYVEYTVYLSHVRRFDEPTHRLLFGRIFGCTVLECPAVHTEIHCVVRVP